MIDNVHQANRILLSFIVRERAHRAHVFRKDPAKLAAREAAAVLKPRYFKKSLRGALASTNPLSSKPSKGNSSRNSSCCFF